MWRQPPGCLQYIIRAKPCFNKEHNSTNGCLRVTLAPCGRHSCDPCKLDIHFFFNKEHNIILVALLEHPVAAFLHTLKSAVN